MSKYIDIDKLIAEIEKRMANIKTYCLQPNHDKRYDVVPEQLSFILSDIDSLQREQPEHMIQWTGHNLKEVIDFTGKSPRFGEWFKSWDEFESYVHSRGDILKLFSEDGSHYEVPVGAWIVKTPDGYNVPSVSRFVQEQPEVDIEKEITEHAINMPHCEFSHESECREDEEWAMREFRHFYELGLNARKER